MTLNPSLDEWIQLTTLRIGALNRASGFLRYPGGKGINVSRVVRELGGATVAYGFAGGEDGDILRQGLRAMGIPHELVGVSGLTRNNYKILTTRPRALTEINASGPTVSGANLRALQRRLLARTPPPRCVALSGSLPPGAPASIYHRWITALHRRRVPVVLDASGEALRRGLSARPWLIKPNRQEMEELFRTRLTRRPALLRAVRHLLRRGPRGVLISLGRDGALLASANPAGVWQATPPAVRVESAVGAGDSMVAGFLVAWRRGHGLLEAFRWGVAAGTATVMTPGTELCHRADVRRLLARVRIRRVE